MEIIPNALHDALSNGVSAGLLFEGLPGLGMREAAEYTARKILNSERLEGNPDFKLVEPEETKKELKSIKVADIMPIIEFSSLKSMTDNRKVVIIDHFELMTVDAQNKLLKTIEEKSSMVVIGIAYADKVIETIKTRMQRIRFNPMPHPDFREYCLENNLTDAEILYLVSGGCTEYIPEIQENMNVFRNVVHAFSNKRMDTFLTAIGMKKEKDASGIFETGTQLIPGLLRLIKGCLLDILSIQANREPVYGLVNVESGSLYRRAAIFESLNAISELNTEIIKGKVALTSADYFAYMIQMM